MNTIQTFFFFGNIIFNRVEIEMKELKNSRYWLANNLAQKIVLICSFFQNLITV